MTHSTDPPISSATGEQDGIPLATADPCFDWTRRLNNLNNVEIRGLLTTWLEVGDRAIRYVSIVAAGGAR